VLIKALHQKGTVAGMQAGAFCIVDLTLPVEKRSLTYSSSFGGTWQPRIIPAGKVNREIYRW